MFAPAARLPACIAGDDRAACDGVDLELHLGATSLIKTSTQGCAALREALMIDSSFQTIPLHAQRVW
jgi:hypothetical protein